MINLLKIKYNKCKLKYFNNIKRKLVIFYKKK
jgi:hypothetical protein